MARIFPPCRTMRDSGWQGQAEASLFVVMKGSKILPKSSGRIPGHHRGPRVKVIAGGKPRPAFAMDCFVRRG
jgi:hypothetical protein